MGDYCLSLGLVREGQIFNFSGRPTPIALPDWLALNDAYVKIYRKKLSAALG
jgi:hypothetical protein